MLSREQQDPQVRRALVSHFICFLAQLLFLFMRPFAKNRLDDLSLINWLWTHSLARADGQQVGNTQLVLSPLVDIQMCSECSPFWGVPTLRLSNHYLLTNTQTNLKTRGNGALFILWPRHWISDLLLYIITAKSVENSSLKLANIAFLPPYYSSDCSFNNVWVVILCVPGFRKQFGITEVYFVVRNGPNVQALIFSCMSSYCLGHEGGVQQKTLPKTTERHPRS